MAGASALQQVLLEHPKAKVNVIVVWEPVLRFDLAPPSSSTLARVSDPRAAQFWDGDRLLSEKLLRNARAHPERLNQEQKKQLADAEIVWDFLALFPPEARWQEPEDPPFPEYSGAPVVDVIGELRRRIRDGKTDRAL